jgi:hypothetical protein
MMNEYKPAAWLLMDGTIVSEYSQSLRKHKEAGEIPLFTQRQWVGLTDEEVKHEWAVWRANVPRYAGFAKGIEAKLKEKNT